MASCECKDDRPLRIERGYLVCGVCGLRLAPVNIVDDDPDEWTPCEGCAEKDAEVESARKARDIALDIAEKKDAEIAKFKSRFTAPIVCICGSTRFRQAWIWENARLTDSGCIVLAVGLWGHHNGGGNLNGVALTDERKAFLDDLHKRKVDLCDWVWVLDVGGYIGESTRSEIAYAEKLGKPIRYLSKEIQNYTEPDDPLVAMTKRAEAAEKRVAELTDKVANRKTALRGLLIGISIHNERMAGRTDIPIPRIEGQVVDAARMALSGGA